MATQSLVLDVLATSGKVQTNETRKTNNNSMKTNMEPENNPLEKEKHLYKPPICGFHVCFRGCNSMNAIHLWYILALNNW